MVLSIVTAVLGSETLAGVIILPAGLLMASMFFTSTYFTFRDSFVADEPPLE
jgi:hypothetical protein